MNLIQQNSLITYITSHKGNCDCKDCEYFGGVDNLLKTFEQENFTDNHLRRIYGWLNRQFKIKGTCDLESLNLNDPTAPKLSDITQCHLDSYSYDKEENYIPLRNQIYV